MDATAISISDKFWSNVLIDGHDGCWEWQGFRCTNGYGRLQVDCVRWIAHRLAWAFIYGEIPDGGLICHHCDNPPCVNPRHLCCGDKKTNMRDAIERGMFVFLLGNSTQGPSLQTTMQERLEGYMIVERGRKSNFRICMIYP